MTGHDYGRRIIAGTLAGLLTGMVSCRGGSEKGESAVTIATGTKVSLEYTLRLEDKTVVDSNVDKEPLTYTQGKNQIIPGLEKELEGMKAGESKQVTIKPEEGYGPVDPRAFQEIGKDRIPADAREVGTYLQGQDSQGRPFRARVAEVKDKSVVLDLNHPLAGKTLFFTVKVLQVQPAPAN